MLMRNIVSFTVRPKDQPPFEIAVDVKRVGCSRHASRDVQAIERQLEDMRARGYQVHGPAGVCFRSRYLLTNEDTIEVQGPQTSGEVEFVVIRYGGGFFVSVGSDHNDRSLEEMETAMLGKVYDTAKSKQMVPAVVAREAWPYDEVRDHWDELVLRSYVTVSGRRVPYQEFKLGALRDFGYYVEHAPWIAEHGSVLFGGTGGILPTVPRDIYQGQSSMRNVVFPTDFQFEMHDPVLRRTISHGYRVVTLEGPGSLSL